MAKAFMGRPYSIFMYPMWQQQSDVQVDYPLVQLSLTAASVAISHYFMTLNVGG